MKKVRRQFIFVSMCSLFFVLFAILAGINALNYRDMIGKVDQVCQMLAEHDGHFPEHMKMGEGNFKRPPEPGTYNKMERERMKEPGFEDFSAEYPFRTRYFSVVTDKVGQTRKTSTENIATVSIDAAKSYAKSVVTLGKETGFEDIYRYKVREYNDGYLVVFVDCEEELNIFKTTFGISLLVSFGGLLAVFLLVWFFSKIIFKPVEESYRKQKQFITDASHELKTPLTIMDANVEVIEMEHGSSQWTQSLHNQVERMSGLVNQLVELSRMNEMEHEIEKSSFCLSEAMDEIVNSYKIIAKTKGKTLRTEILEDIFCRGNENRIRQAIGLLMDNAMKYSTTGAEIEIGLRKKGMKVYLYFQNPCEEIGAGKKDILFERFYRVDSSHNSQTGGTGIGLSVVKSIIENHNGKIRAFSKTGKDLKIEIFL